MDTTSSATWRKSTYSGGSGSECVEAGVADRGLVLVRDTKNRDGATLAISGHAWEEFLGTLR